ncbi:MAG: TolC family protein [Candidatus Poribacteria bacterium]|nr:TolC family protein [Candidatus Poribacteria bacterium]
MLRKYIVFTVLLLFQTFCCVLPWVADAEPFEPSPDEIADLLTLELSIDYALGKSREFQVAEKDVAIAAEKVKAARAALFPHLSLNSGYTFSGDLPKIVLEGGLPGLPPPPAGTEPEPLELELGAYHTMQGNLRLTYPLWTWGQVGNRYHQAVLGQRAAERALRAVELDIELKVRQAFHNLLLTDAFVGVAEQSLSQVQRRFKLAEEQKATGVLTQLEVIRANV